jgi:hypothetical protein
VRLQRHAEAAEAVGDAATVERKFETINYFSKKGLKYFVAVLTHNVLLFVAGSAPVLFTERQSVIKLWQCPA